MKDLPIEESDLDKQVSNILKKSYLSLKTICIKAEWYFPHISTCLNILNIYLLLIWFLFYKSEFKYDKLIYIMAYWLALCWW